MNDAPPARAKPRLIRILAVVGLVLLIVAGLLWLNRRAIVREVLTGWLRARGIPADARVEDFGPTVFAAQMRIGDPRNPDFVTERAEVRYRVRLTGLEMVSVTLRKPVLRAQYRNGALKVGALDPLLQDFLRRPPKPGLTAPAIRVDGGVLVLTTDYGPLRVTADARLTEGELDTLVASAAPTRLSSPEFDVNLGAVAMRATRRGDRLDLSLSAPVVAAKVAMGELADGRLSVSAQIPYPDLKARRGDGKVTASLGLTGRRVVAGEQALDDLDLKAGFTGQAKGWIPDLDVRGQATASVQAGGGRFGGGQAETVRVALTSGDLHWTRKGGDQVAATVRLNAGAAALSAGDLRLKALGVTADGPVVIAASGVEANVNGAVVAQGGWTGLGPVAADDAPEMAAIKRAARDFRLAAPALSLRAGAKGLTVGAPQPIRLQTASGGAATLTAQRGSPLFGPDGGAFRLVVAGGGLPGVEADVARFALTPGGLSANGRVQAQASLGLMQGGAVDASGRISLANGALAFAADRCVAFTVQRLDFGANDIERLGGRLCPTGGPLFALANGDWTLKGRAEAMSGAAPFVQAAVSGGAGVVDVRTRRGQMSAQVKVTAAQLEDAAPTARFRPLALSGDVTLAEYIWRADLTARGPGGLALGQALVTHDGRLGLGVAVLDTGLVTFASGGLQPVQISPMAAAISGAVNGSVRFTGRFDWTPTGSTSSGALSIPRLDFHSPFGPVEGVKGELVLSSLAPLTAAEGQTLTIARIQGPVLLENIRAAFSIGDNIINIASGEAFIGGGRLQVESLEVPLIKGAPIRGVVGVDGVQLHDLVEASPFGDKVDLDAKVSGRIPFEMVGNRVRISSGELKAVQPGRISISRTALTGVAAASTTPGAAPNPNDTFTDFAYQAMEHLAFDTLEASIKSQPDGRLGVLFHIVGRHDPPTKQQIKLSLVDLIRRRFLERPLALPSNTGVNLTLDTTLNLDDLLSDWGEYQKARGSRGVQP